MLGNCFDSYLYPSTIDKNDLELIRTIRTIKTRQYTKNDLKDSPIRLDEQKLLLNKLNVKIFSLLILSINWLII